MVLLVSPRVVPRVPAALLVMAVTGALVKLFGLDGAGVKIVGAVPRGLPPLRMPSFPLDDLPRLCGEAAGVALIGFSSMMLTARSFASKNRYDIDVDQEFAALGAADIAAALSQGFAVSGADSRTAMSDAAGGRTRVTGLITALTVVSVLVFLTSPLQYVPIAALGAVLVGAAYSLVDLRSLKMFYRVDWREFVLSILATLGVVAVGTVQAILVAVILALLRFVKMVSRPRVEVLGRVPGLPGLHSVERHAGAATTPGLLLFRFNAALTFFNAAFFKRSVLDAARAAGPSLKWFVLDMIPLTTVDFTGMQTASEVIETLRSSGISFVRAGRETEWREWALSRRFTEGARSFPTLRAAIKAYERENLLSERAKGERSDKDSEMGEGSDRLDKTES